MWHECGFEGVFYMTEFGTDKYWKKGLWRNKCVFAVLRWPITAFLRLKFDFRAKRYTPKNKTFLLLTNHNSTMDHFMNAAGVKGYMRFVVSDHLMRKGLLSFALRFLVNPIPRRKGGSGAQAVEMIKKNLSLGIPVILYAEGNRSFNGRTGFISPRTGALVKEAEGALITYRIEGAYMQTPRWAKYKRKGPVFGKVIGEYSREELNKMTVEEINRLIARDLFVDEYANQRANKIPYRGENLAENLETALFTCPKCGEIGMLESKGNEFFCKCGMKTRLNEYGFFEGGGLPFDNVYDWDKWQNAAFVDRVDSLKKENALVTEDTGIVLFEVFGNEKKTLMENARMRLFADRLVFEADGKTETVLLSDIRQTGVAHTQFLYFSAGERYFEVRADHIWCARKYFALHRMLTGMEYV